MTEQFARPARRHESTAEKAAENRPALCGECHELFMPDPWDRWDIAKGFVHAQCPTHGEDA